MVKRGPGLRRQVVVFGRTLGWPVGRGQDRAVKRAPSLAVVVVEWAQDSDTDIEGRNAVDTGPGEAVSRHRQAKRDSSTGPVRLDSVLERSAHRSSRRALRRPAR